MPENMNVNLNTVVLKDRDMEAWLILVPPPEGTEYSYEEIEELLKKHGVISGVNLSKVHAMVKKKIYNRSVLIAQGTPQVDGIDGYFDYSFETERSSKPAIREDGSVDYTSMNVVSCVQAGDIVAVYHPSVPGKGGISVKGRTLLPKPAKELKPYNCVKVSYDEENMTYRALVEGRVELSKAQIKIVEVQELELDIDNTYGNVNFNGDIIIHGDVKPGVTICATRTVTIDGVLEGSNVVAGTDVLVKKGVVGNDTSSIKAGGNVTADYVQYSTIEANGDIIANSFLGSRIFAKGVVRAEGEIGAVIGGAVYGMSGIVTSFAGNDVGVRTILRSGIRQNMMQEKLRLEKKLKESEQQTVKRLDEEAELERNIRLGTANEAQLKRKQELMREKIENSTAVKEMEGKLREINALIERAKDPKIEVDDTLYENTVILIDEQQFLVDSARRQITFYKDETGVLRMKRTVNWE